MSESGVVHDLVTLGVDRSCMAQTDIILNPSVIDHVRVAVQDDLCCDVIEELLPLLILALFIIANRGKRASVADNFCHSVILRPIGTSSLLCQKFIFILKPSHFEESFAMVANDMITNF